MTGKLLLSLFVSLNLLTVLVANQPPSFEEAKAHFLAAHLTPDNAYRLRYGEWLIRRYAHLVGLDNRWKMFSTLHRFDWRFIIKAHYADGREEVLPLARQSKRSFFEGRFFDFKEAKMQLNIYGHPELRRAYGRYLCRATEEWSSERPVFIIYELEHQMILDRKEAARLGTHHEPHSHTRVLQVVDCAWTKPRLKGSVL